MEKFEINCSDKIVGKSNYIHYLINKVSANNEIIQICGLAGSGKSTIAMQIVKGWLLQNLNNENIKLQPKYILWIDTENKFSKDKFIRINPLMKEINKRNNGYVSSNSSKYLLKYLKYLLIYNPKSLKEQINIVNIIYKSLKEIQQNFVKTTIANNKKESSPVFARNKASPQIKSNFNLNLVNNLYAIVIDSVSNHLRLEAAKNAGNLSLFYKYLESFFEEHILPLLFIQNKLNCKIILTHQISSKPNGEHEASLKFLFEKIKSCWIYLTPENSKSFILNIKGNSGQIFKKYKLKPNGIQILF
ncbi:MAG: hypothetical protein ACTSO2_10825 [Promethearchaeota archaeon]